MTNEEKKLWRCISCGVAYNVAKLKPGSKFKCHKCQTINTIPEEEVILEPELMEVEPQAPPTPMPPKVTPAAPSAPPSQSTELRKITTQIPKPTPSAPPPTELVRKSIQPSQQPSVATSPTSQTAHLKPVQPPAPAPTRLQSKRVVTSRATPYSRLSKFGKRHRLPSRVTSKESTEGMEGEEEVPQEKKSNTPLIIGIVAAAVIILVIIILIATRDKPEKPLEPPSTPVAETGRPTQSVSPPTPKLRDLSEWKPVAPEIKEKVRNLIEQIRQAPNMAESAKLRLQLVQMGDICIAALIDIYLNSPNDYEEKVIPDWLRDWTKKEPDVGRGPIKKKLKGRELVEWYKKAWLNKDIDPRWAGYKFPPPKVVEQLEKEMSEIPSAASLQPIKPVAGFEYDKSLSPQIVEILKYMAGYRKGEPQWDEGARKIKTMGKSAIPVLIMEIANPDLEIGTVASELLLDWTGRDPSDAPTINPMIGNEAAANASRDWQEWWLANKDKF